MKRAKLRILSSERGDFLNFLAPFNSSLTFVSRGVEVFLPEKMIQCPNLSRRALQTLRREWWLRLRGQIHGPSGCWFKVTEGD